MYVAGIDFDTHAVHVVLLELDSDRAQHWCAAIAKGGDAFDRTRRIRDVMPSRGYWDDEGVVAIGIERPMGFRSALGSHTLLRAQGAILACLPSATLVHELAPQEWKRDSLGKGNASKTEVLHWAHEHWLPMRDRMGQDEADAFCIAWAIRGAIATESADAA